MQQFHKLLQCPNLDSSAAKNNYQMTKSIVCSGHFVHWSQTPGSLDPLGLCTDTVTLGQQPKKG